MRVRARKAKIAKAGRNFQKGQGSAGRAFQTAGVRPLHVIIACVILLGIGILTGVTRTRSKDRSA